MANQYAIKADRQHIYTGGHAEKHNAKETAMATLRDVIIGAGVGTLAGALIGRGTFVFGLGATLAGHYFDSKLVSIAGIGMMASGVQVVKTAAVNGPEESNATLSADPVLDGVKDRLLALKQSWMEKLFLDKIMKKTATTPATNPATNGFGDIQYFNYLPAATNSIDEMAELPESTAAPLPVSGPEDNNATLSADSALDMSGLDAIEEQVLNQGMAGLRGFNNMETIADIPEELYGDRAVETLQFSDVSEKLY